jgi:energy-coupling factor transporter transmembrane protein EcfT
MKILFIAIILFHGVLHGLGTTRSVSYLSGTPMRNAFYKLLWLFTSIAFFVTAGLVFMQKDWWWMVALIAVLLSQYLVIKHWQIAKYGTILNILIFLFAVIGFTFWKFQKTYPREVISQIHHNYL